MKVIPATLGTIRVRRVVGVLLALLLVVALFVFVLVKPQLDAAVFVMSHREAIGQLRSDIEAFRKRNGRLPGLDEVTPADHRLNYHRTRDSYEVCLIKGFDSAYCLPATGGQWYWRAWN